ncbi:MAG: winged helix-turn-helix transcriptional regulator [Lachnospiraceae bacterium]|nr:winged helix-turn-helix transcriptional regulator [Lachnospiraceae bacterium]
MSRKIEYDSITNLKGTAAHFFTVPKSVIENTELDYRRVALFVYLRSYKGLNERVCFSVPLFLQWANLKNDTHSGGVNDKIIDTLDCLNDLGYVTYLGDKPKNKTFCMDVQFNTQQVFDECSSDRFAIVYLDEIEKIMTYRNMNIKDTHFNCNAVLLVFVFLRMMINRRPNQLKPEEQSIDKIEERKQRLPEAYNDTYKDIAEILGLSERTVSKSVEVLEELGLIMMQQAYHIKIADGEYRTADMIFANMQKRDRGELLASGKEYAYAEIVQKAKNINQHNKYYHLKTGEI